MTQPTKKSFLQHPFVQMTRITSTKPSTKAPISFQQQKQHIFNLKRLDIEAKKKQLQQNNRIIQSLKQNLLSSSNQIEIQKQKLQSKLQSLRQEERQKQLELESCQEIESIDPEEYKVWNEESARRNHKARMKVLRQEFEVLRESKTQELADLKSQLQDILNEQRELTLKLEMLRGEESNIIETEEIMYEEQSEEEIPDTDKIISDIAKLRESIIDLEEENINLINKVKQDLDSSNWSVRQRFNECKQRIQKQIKKLTDIIEKSDNQVFRKVQNTDKIADPNNLIQDYQNRLKKIQDSLPEELKEEKIFQCLKPLPWRTIKGINIENKSNSAVHQKFEKLMSEFAEVEEENKRYKQVLSTKQSEIQIVKSKINEYEAKIQELREEL